MGNVTSNNMAEFAGRLSQFLSANGIANMTAKLRRKIKMEFAEVK